MGPSCGRGAKRGDKAGETGDLDRSPPSSLLAASSPGEVDVAWSPASKGCKGAGDGLPSVGRADAPRSEPMAWSSTSPASREEDAEGS